MDIKSFLTKYENGQVQISPGVEYNTKDIINANYRVFHSKFEDPVGEGGLQKLMINITRALWNSIIFNSDIDLQHLNFRSLNGKGIMVLRLFRLAIITFLRRIFFGKKVDEILQFMAWHGSAVVKRVDGDIELVDLRNYVTNTNIQDTQQRFHAEKTYLTYDKMLANKDEWTKHNKEAWSEIESVWEKMQKEGVSLFTVIEFWSEKEKNGKIHKVCEKYLDRSILSTDHNETDWSPHVELDCFITPYKKRRPLKFMRNKLGEYEELYPYEQVNFIECPGRWIGFGVRELLEDVHQLYQELVDGKRHLDILGLKGVYVHKKTDSSDSLTQDFLNNLTTGDVLQLDKDEDLQRLIIDTKTSEYLANIDKLFELARMLVGIRAETAGEDMPKTTATEAIMNQKTQQTTFDYVREQMHHFLVRLMMNGYLAEIIDQVTEEEIVAVEGDARELEDLDDYYTEQTLNKWAIETRNTTGLYPTEEEYIQIEESIKSELQKLGSNRFAEIKKDILKYLEYIVAFDVTNESFDRGLAIKKLERMQASAVANPNSRISPDAVEDRILDLMNENPRQFHKTREEVEEERKRQEMMMMQEQMANQMPQAPGPVEGDMEYEQVGPANEPM